MRKTLPTIQADGLSISPETLKIANVYLETSDIGDTANIMGVDRHIVVSVLAKKEVRHYIDTVFLNAGWISRNKIAEALDKIINKKMLELEEAEIGSSKDIADLLAMAHKFRMDEIKAINDAAKIGEANNIRKQVNVQINDGVGGNNYNALIQKLVDNDGTKS